MRTNHLRPTNETRDRYAREQHTGLFIACFEDFTIGAFTDLGQDFVHVNVSIAPLIVAHVFATLKNTESRPRDSVRFSSRRNSYRGRFIGLSGSEDALALELDPGWE